jgi:hypothetical protein
MRYIFVMNIGADGIISFASKLFDVTGKVISDSSWLPITSIVTRVVSSSKIETMYNRSLITYELAGQTLKELPTEAFKNGQTSRNGNPNLW